MRVFHYEVPPEVLNALLARLNEGPATATQLVGCAVMAGAPGRGYTADRIVDRWLQSQRKAGRIKFMRNREWRLCPSSTSAGEP